MRSRVFKNGYNFPLTAISKGAQGTAGPSVEQVGLLPEDTNRQAIKGFAFDGVIVPCRKIGKDLR